MDKAYKNVTLLVAAVLAWFAVLMITRVKAQFLHADTLYYAGAALFLAGILAINFMTNIIQNTLLLSVSIFSQLMGFSLVFFISQSTDALVLLVIFAGQLPFFLTQKRAIIFLLCINFLCFLVYLFMWDKGFTPSLIAIVLNVAFQFFALSVANIAVREKEARVALEQSNAELMSTRSLLEQTSRQAERLKLSRDLHDICGHQLTGLLLHLEYLSKTVAPQQQQRVNETKQIAKDLLNEIRAVVRQNKATAQLDLNAAIDSLFAHLPEVTAEFSNRLSAPLLSGHHAEVMLRICQEAVSNAIRYGSEKRIQIALFKHADELIMDVSNAFNEKMNSREGSGLHNMRERAAELGGTVTIKNENNKWVVNVRLPYKEQSYD